MKTVFDGAVVNVENEGVAFVAIRSTREQAQFIDEMTGRIDPDTMELRAKVSEAGDLENGRTVSVNDVPHTILSVNPDSIDAMVRFTVKKRKTTAL